MSIRRATLADAKRISRLLTQLGYPGTEDFLEIRLASMLQDPDEIILVWESPPVQGFLSLHFIPQIAKQGDFARISYFCVDETARSAGIGRQLEAEATRLARERGCDRLEVHCGTQRPQAHGFYSRQGYIESPKYLIKKL